MGIDFITASMFGFGTAIKADQADISAGELAQLKDAGASPEEIDAVVSKAREDRKNQLLEQVANKYDTSSQTQPGQEMSSLLAEMSAMAPTPSMPIGDTYVTNNYNCGL